MMKYAYRATRLLIIFVVFVFALVRQRTSLADEAPLGWVPLATGIEYALAPRVAAGHLKGVMLIARVDPASAIFRIHFKPGQRKPIQQWAIEKPGAVIIVNTSFFRGNGKPSGLVRIGNDILSAASGRPDSAQFEVVGESPVISPIDLLETIPSPDNPGPYIESVEGHPLLIRNGAATPDSFANSDLSRRTVIAQDNKGRILIINTETVLTSLQDLTDWILNTDLGIVTALNMDGGASSQIYMATDQVAQTFKRGSIGIPVVLAVYPR